MFAQSSVARRFSAGLRGRSPLQGLERGGIALLSHAMTKGMGCDLICERTRLQPLQWGFVFSARRFSVGRPSGETTFIDALYVALADLHATPLWTADEPLCKAVDDTSLIRWIGDYQG